MNRLSFKQGMGGNSILSSKGAMPSKTGVADGGSTFAMGRSIYSGFSLAVDTDAKKRRSTITGMRLRSLSAGEM